MGDLATLLAAIGTLITAVVTAIALLIVNIPKIRAGVAARKRTQRTDITDERDYANYKSDVLQRNLTATLDRQANNRRIAIGDIGIDGVTQKYGPPPELEAILTFREWMRRN